MLSPEFYNPSGRDDTADRRPTLLLQNFGISHNRLRGLASKAFKGLASQLRMVSGPRGDTQRFENYLNAMGESKFVLSPPGKNEWYIF